MRGKHVTFLIENGIKARVYDPATKQLHLTFRTREVRNLFLGLFGFLKSGPEQSATDRLVWILNLTKARSSDPHLDVVVNLADALNPVALDVFFPDFLSKALAGNASELQRVECATIPLS